MRSRLVIPAVLIVTAAYMKGRRDGRLELRPEPLAPPEPAAPVSPLMDPAVMAQALAADAVELAEAQTAASGATLIVPRAAATAPDPDAEWEDPFASPDLRTASEWVAAPASPRPAAPAADDGLDLAISTEWATNLATAAPPAEEPEIAFAGEFTPEFAAEFTPEDESGSEAEPRFSIEVTFDETGRFSLGGFATQAGHIALAGITFRERRSGLVAPDSISLVTEAASNVAPGGLVVLGDAGFAPDAEGFTILIAAEGPGTFAAAGYYQVAAA